MKNSIVSSMPEDLEHILFHTRSIWEDMRGKKIFITGGTGFFGKWFLESFIFANQQLSLSASLTVLSRDSRGFLKQYPYFQNHDSLFFRDGDIREFAFGGESFDYVIHAATEVYGTLNKENPLFMWDTIVEGTKRILDFAIFTKAKKFLLLSSGAVYGPCIEGDDLYESNPVSATSKNIISAYSYGKISSEQLAMLYYQTYGLDVKVARCFAFVGPYLALDAHFAVGNFILNTLRNEPITIKGNGQAIRSYMYAADLMIFLWSILINGRAAEVYNVGSDQSISILELAHRIQELKGTKSKIECHFPRLLNEPKQYYVPNIDKIKKELNLKVLIDLDSALEKTFQWNQAEFFIN